MANRRQRPQRLLLAVARAGETRYAVSHTARDAAKRAAQYAAKGYRVAVMTDPGQKLKMTCVPRGRGPDRMNIASCDVDPSFKQQVKGLAGLKRRR